MRWGRSPSPPAIREELPRPAALPQAAHAASNEPTPIAYDDPPIARFLEPMTAPSRWRAVWKARWLLIAAAIVAAGIAIAVSRVIPTRYSASAVVRVTLPQSAGLSEQSVQAANTLASQYSQVATAGPIVERAAVTLGGDGRGLSGDVSASTVSSENLVQISARASTSAVAVARANAMATAFAEYLNAENLKTATASTRAAAKQLTRVQARLQSAGLKLDTELARRESGKALTVPQRAELDALQAEVASLDSLQQSLLTREQSSGTPSLKLFSPATTASKTQPRPLLYAIVAFIVVLLGAAQIVSFVAANRTPAR